MLATALPKLLFHTAAVPPSWPDVSGTDWAQPFITAVGSLLPGTAPGSPFRPDQVLTRQEAAAWTVQAFGWAPLPAAAATAFLGTYPDGAATAQIDAGLFAAAVNLGLVVGDAGTGDLQPGAPIDRAEAAVLVLRAMQMAPAVAAPAAG